MKDGKFKSKLKNNEDMSESPKAPCSIDNSRPVSPTNSDHCAELTPSEDEADNVDNVAPSPIPVSSLLSPNK